MSFRNCSWFKSRSKLIIVVLFIFIIILKLFIEVIQFDFLTALGKIMAYDEATLCVRLTPLYSRGASPGHRQSWALLPISSSRPAPWVCGLSSETPPVCACSLEPHPCSLPATLRGLIGGGSQTWGTEGFDFLVEAASARGRLRSDGCRRGARCRSLCDPCRCPLFACRPLASRRLLDLAARLSQSCSLWVFEIRCRLWLLLSARFSHLWTRSHREECGDKYPLSSFGRYPRYSGRLFQCHLRIALISVHLLPKLCDSI